MCVKVSKGITPALTGEEHVEDVGLWFDVIERQMFLGISMYSLCDKG